MLHKNTKDAIQVLQIDKDTDTEPEKPKCIVL